MDAIRDGGELEGMEQHYCNQGSAAESGRKKKSRGMYSKKLKGRSRRNRGKETGSLGSRNAPLLGKEKTTNRDKVGG